MKGALQRRGGTRSERSKHLILIPVTLLIYSIINISQIVTDRVLGSASFKKESSKLFMERLGSDYRKKKTWSEERSVTTLAGE